MRDSINDSCLTPDPPHSRKLFRISLVILKTQGMVLAVNPYLDKGFQTVIKTSCLYSIVILIVSSHHDGFILLCGPVALGSDAFTYTTPMKCEV